MTDTPPVKKIPEGDRDPDLDIDSGGKGRIPAPVEIGDEDFRDGKTDDGEQDSDDALSKS